MRYCEMELVEYGYTYRDIKAMEYNKMLEKTMLIQTKQNKKAELKERLEKRRERRN